MECSRFDYYLVDWNMKTTYSNNKTIFNNSTSLWWPVTKYSLRKRQILKWVWWGFHKVIFQTKGVIFNGNIWKYLFGLGKFSRLQYIEEIIFKTITHVIIYVDTAITLPSSILNVYEGKFVLCVYTIYTEYHDYNIELFFC